MMALFQLAIIIEYGNFNFIAEASNIKIHYYWSFSINQFFDPFFIKTFFWLFQIPI